MMTDTMPTQAPADKTTQAVTILQRSFCLTLSVGWLGNWRKVDTKSLKMEKDGETLESGEKKSLTVTKRLVDAEFLRPVEAIISAAKNDMRRVSLSGHRVFGPGTFIVPNQRVLDVEQMLSQRLEQLEEAKATLADQWPDVVEKSKARLGKLFNASEFPTAEDVLADYQLEWSYVSFSTPDRLEEVDAAIFEASKAKYQQKLSAAYDEVVVQLRATALTVMKELANRLKPGADGKAKALMPTALRDIQNLMEQLPVLNLTDDDLLADIVTKVGAIANGLDVDTLRKAPGIRSMLLTAAEQATAELDGLIESGFRSIDLS